MSCCTYITGITNNPNHERRGRSRAFSVSNYIEIEAMTYAKI